MRVLIVGPGFVGSLLGFELARQGHEVHSLRRTPGSGSVFRVTGVKAFQADITQPETLMALPCDFDWVVNCAASGGGSAEDYRQLYLEGTQNLIEWLGATPLKKFVYTSSTSVYGQNDGSLVTENDPVMPETGTAKVLVEAENLLFSAHRKLKFPAVILRVAGIYGPGRGYWLKQFLSGEARLDGDGSRYLNMIHLSDIVGAIIAALESSPICTVYNAVDNEPVSQRDLFEWLAAKLNKPMPTSALAEAQTNRKRAVTNKRVSNQRLRKELSYQFVYPTFRQGYTAEIARLQKAGEA
jgi:nucleoside-diphosphate-sugar epimerase